MPRVSWKYFTFPADELEWLAKTFGYDKKFTDYLNGLKFAGEVDAVPEGISFFASEPLFCIVAPLPFASNWWRASGSLICCSFKRWSRRRRRGAS